MRQRADYTFKYNKSLGRHGWLRLTPAYSVKLVEEILLGDIFSEKKRPNAILDPFCGTATTGIVASKLGLNCDLYDINPFLVWFGRIKSMTFSPSELSMIYEKVKDDIKDVDLKVDNSLWIPPMKNIERWWNESTINTLASLRRYISNFWGEPSFSGAYNVLWIAFARLCMETSAADFNHISVTVKEQTQDLGLLRIKVLFLNILQSIMLSASDALKGKVIIYNSDSRFLAKEGKYDMVITSPPYPNRISYIRELRPYMYWLKFLNSGEEAGELDWRAIGGTWGTATSRLAYWKNESPGLPTGLLNVCQKIKESDKKNGYLLSQYVLKFFDDMYVHFSNLRKHLHTGAEIYYILGNSSFYGNYVYTDEYITVILNQLGFSEISTRVIRKRNCNKGLFEYCIKATWMEQNNID